MNPYLWVLAGLAAGLVAISLARLRRTHTGTDFLVAGRSLPAGVLIFTLLSSWIGAGSLFAGAENAFHNGMAALWMPAGGWAGLIIIYFVAPRARQFAQYTIPDLLETRFGPATRLMGMIAILLAYTAITSYQFKGGGDILALTTGISPTQGTAIIAGFVIAFTALAGMSSIAYLDVAIGLIATVGLLAALPVLLAHAGGWTGVERALPATHFEVLGNLSIWQALGYFLPVFLLMLGNQNMYQKFFSARSPRDARRAVVGWVIGTIILETVIVVLAVIGSALYHGAPGLKPREIIAYTARHGLPVWLGAVLMGAIFAKVVSTGNNYLFSPATNLVHDVYARWIRPQAGEREILIASRWMVVLMGVFALAQTFQASVLTVMLYAYTIYSAAITPVVMAAFFWKRATRQGAAVSVGLGIAVTVGWNVIPMIAGRGTGALAPVLHFMRGMDAVYPAVAISVLALLIVSWCTPAPIPQQPQRPLYQTV